MSTLKYEIVEHDGGWAYKADGVFSETFSSHDAAHRAAEAAAGRQRRPGEDTAISFEDADGRWRNEISEGGDRPKTSLED